MAGIWGHAFSALVAGTNHVCGLRIIDNKAFCWGENEGQLGNGGTGNQNLPSAVSGNLVFKALTAGLWPTCGLTTTGDIYYYWGKDTLGVFGHLNTRHLVPQKVPLPPAAFERRP